MRLSGTFSRFALMIAARISFENASIVVTILLAFIRGACLQLLVCLHGQLPSRAPYTFISNLTEKLALAFLWLTAEMCRDV